MAGESEGKPQRTETRLSTIDSNLAEIKEQLKNIVKKINAVENKVSGQTEKLAKIEGICTLCEKMNEDMNAIKAENRCLKDRVKAIEKQLDIEQKLKKRKDIEIHGIPDMINENLPDIINKLAGAAKVTVGKDEIEECFRVKATDGRTRPITIKFRSAITRDKILKALKFAKLRLGDINKSPENKKIFANEALIPSRKRLLFMTKEASKEKNWIKIWSYAGDIYVITEQNGRPIKLEREEDLEILLQK